DQVAVVPLTTMELVYMRMLIWRIGLFMVALGHTSAAHAELPRLRVMPLGDSITWGLGSSSGAGYRLPLLNMAASQERYLLDYVGSQRSGNISDPDNEGHSGWFIDDIRNHVDDWLATYHPDLVILEIGINDLRSPNKDNAPQRLGVLVD